MKVRIIAIKNIIVIIIDVKNKNGWCEFMIYCFYYKSNWCTRIAYKYCILSANLKIEWPIIHLNSGEWINNYLSCYMLIPLSDEILYVFIDFQWSIFIPQAKLNVYVLFETIDYLLCKLITILLIDWLILDCQRRNLFSKSFLYSPSNKITSDSFHIFGAFIHIYSLWIIHYLSYL